MNRERVKAQIAEYEGYCKDHVLTTLVETATVGVYQCAKPGTRAMSFQVSFTPAGIALQGDFCPDGNGVCSAYGYGAGWFCSHLETDYLASKFLEKLGVDLDEGPWDWDEGQAAALAAIQRTFARLRLARAATEETSDSLLRRH